MTNKRTVALKKIQKIYEESFPEIERRTFNNLCSAFERFTYINLQLIEETDKTIGFIIYWEFREFIYVEYFAISEELRGGGLGKKAFHEFAKRQTKPIVLEVELPENDIAIRRIGFYERLGFILQQVEYIQPPYHPNMPDLPLLLMTYGDIDFPKALLNIKSEIYKHCSYLSYI